MSDAVFIGGEFQLVDNLQRQMGIPSGDQEDKGKKKQDWGQLESLSVLFEADKDVHMGNII